MAESAPASHPLTAPGLSPRAFATIMVLGYAMALVGCYLPWVEHPAGALAPNALDLAEWASLHPAVRGGSPPLLLTFLLRLPLALVGVGIAYAARWGWLPGLVIALTLLPPLEFFRGASSDPNFRQGFALAAMAGALVLFSLPARRLAERVRWALPVFPAAIGVVATMIGAPQAMRLINEMYAADYGTGGPLALTGFMLIVVGVPYTRFILPRRFGAQA